MATTIQVSNELLDYLKSMKVSNKESYEEIIWNLLEDVSEISEETKKMLRESEDAIKEGKVQTLSKVKKEFGLNV